MSIWRSMHESASHIPRRHGRYENAIDFTAMAPSSRKAYSIVIIADDLTGACDAAVHFASPGLTTYVGLHFDDQAPAGWEAYAINTDTRSSSRAEAAMRVAHACEYAQQLKAKRIVKKIDSMMRGNIAAEIEAARSALRPRLTLLAPAFPALGRTVYGGHIRIDGREEPIRIADRLEGFRWATVPAGAAEEIVLHFAHAMDRGIDILIPDTANERDLQSVALAATGIDGLLWVGSAGLAQAIASTIDAVPQPSVVTTRKPLLLGVGSDHEVTLGQIERLRVEGHAAFVSAGAASYRRVNEYLFQGRDVVLRFERAQLDAAALKEFAKSIRIDLCGGLILTGGDTSMRILEALGARILRSRLEILPGIPQGVILGGAADGLFVVTKSGAFGGPDALSRCIERLRTSPADARMQPKEGVQ